MYLQQILWCWREEESSRCSPEIQILIHQKQGAYGSTSILIQWSNDRTKFMHWEFTADNLFPRTAKSVRERNCRSVVV